MIACIYISFSERKDVPIALLEKLSRDVTIFLLARTPAVEREGLREWFVDLTGCNRLLRNDFAGWGVQIARLLKSHLDLASQVGIASNKVTAELASRLSSPGSALWLFSEGEKEFIGRISLDQLPRLTEKQRQVFRIRRLQWVWEVKELGEDHLWQCLGNKDGHKIWQVIHGICDEPVKSCRIPRVIKKTQIFSSPTICLDDVIRAGVYLAGNLYHEIHKLGGVLQKITCRLIYVDDLEASREIHVAGLNREEEYAAAVVRMLENIPLRRVQVRLLQLKCPVQFEAAEQQDLFSERERLKRRDLDQALKDVREKYGVESLHRASGTTRRQARTRRIDQ